METMPDRRYGEIREGRVVWIFYGAQLPEYNAAMTVVDLTDHPQVEEGWVIVPDEHGNPVAIQPQPESPTVNALCHRIDTAADAARRAVAGDPLRAVEYDRARIEAEQFAAAGYQGDVPPMVAAWAINGRSPQQAADDILAEAQQYEAALVQLRTLRLAAKEQIRALMAAEQVEQAQQLAAQTVAAIEAAVAGIGNNAG